MKQSGAIELPSKFLIACTESALNRLLSDLEILPIFERVPETTLINVVHYPSLTPKAIPMIFRKYCGFVLPLAPDTSNVADCRCPGPTGAPVL